MQQFNQLVIFIQSNTMEEYCQNETMKRLCQKDPILFYKIMSYDRQIAEDSKQLQNYMCKYRQSSISIVRNVELRQKDLNIQTQYKFPLKGNLKNRTMGLQKETDQQKDPQFQILKARKYNLYSQNKQKDIISSSTNKKSSSSCLKKRNLFIIKRKQSNNNVYSDNPSKNDSFQLNSPKYLKTKTNTKQIMIQQKYQKQKQNLFGFVAHQNQDLINKTIGHRNLSKAKPNQNYPKSNSVSKQSSTIYCNRTQTSSFMRSLHSNSEKQKLKLKKRSVQRNQGQKLSIGDLTQDLILKKGGKIARRDVNKSKFFEFNKIIGII